MLNFMRFEMFIDTLPNKINDNKSNIKSDKYNANEFFH